MKRREFLTIPAASVGGTLLYTLAGEPFRLKAQTGSKGGTLKVPLRFFTAKEARVVAAACERIFPSDDTGPGATEAGVVIFIDRQLAGPYGRDKYRYKQAPWVQSVAEHGYQGKENSQEIYRQGIQSLGDFDSLPVDEQVKKLQALEHTPLLPTPAHSHDRRYVLRPDAWW
jgi:gluconate 2-dehydrogenase gamma chain